MPSGYTADGENTLQLKLRILSLGSNMPRTTKGQAMDLIQNSIKGIEWHVTGVTNDFSTVGVKALDDYTVEYTLTHQNHIEFKDNQ